MADVVDGLKPEFVDADGLRHRDLDLVVVVLGTFSAPTTTPSGVTTWMKVWKW